MDLVLGLTTAIASMIAFSIGYIFGKMKQADKDKADVFNAIYNVSKKDFWNTCSKKESQEWVKGALTTYKWFFDAIFKVFYGEKTKCGSGRDKTTDEDDDLPEEL